VPHFTGIRIHGGKTAEHTHGCILVGRNKIKGQLVESAPTLNALIERLREAQNITLQIV